MRQQIKPAKTGTTLHAKESPLQADSLKKTLELQNSQEQISC